MAQELREHHELLEMALAESDEAMLESVAKDLSALEQSVADLEFRRMFSNPMDPNNCFVDIQSGQGGTEAQDWASMLERMYLRFCERRGFAVEVLEESPGEVAGIKSAALKVSGDYAYGTLRTETGVHRLVRKSPFDSNARRHTSFASVFVYPEVDDTIEIEINPADLRVDTFRASGAGGQHVNKTDSADPHHPPADRHRGAVPERPLAAPQPRRGDVDAQGAPVRGRAAQARGREAEDGGHARPTSRGATRSATTSWTNRIIKDLRTNVEMGNTRAVLDGDLDQFITASLKQGV